MPVGQSVLDEPLVGRSVEISAIDEAWARRAAGLVLSGPVGVGKSRVARAGRDSIKARGSDTVAVQATASAATVPLGAFASVVELPRGLDDPFDRMHVAAEVIRRRAGGGRLALSVEDAHLLDPPSAAVVLNLASDRTVFVLATIRTDTPCPDAVSALWKDAGATRIELEPFSAGETRMLAESLVGGPIEEKAADWVFSTSLGNALYARELVLGAVSAGALRNERGYWRLDGKPPISATLADVVDSRFAVLDAAERDLVDLLAVADSLRIGELVDQHGAGTIERVEEAGLVVVDEAGDVVLAHPLYGETVRPRLPSLRARLLGAEAARILAARSELTPRDVLRIAEWRLAAGEPVDAETMVEAARIANLSGRPELGAVLAKRALDGGLGVNAALTLARAHSLRNRHAEAAEILAAAENQIESQEQAADLLEQQTDALYWGLNDSEGLNRLLARAEGWWSSDDWEKRLVPLRVMIAHALRAEGLGEQIDSLLAEPLDRAIERQIEPLRAARLLFSGQGADAWRVARAFRPLPPLRDHADDFASAVYLLVAAETGEDWDELRSWAAKLRTDGARLGDESALARGALTLGVLCFWEGRFRDASRWLSEAELQLERRDSIGALAAARSFLVGVACFTGDANGAALALERFRAALGPGGPLPSQRAPALRAEAWALLADGSADRAQQLLLEGSEQLTKIPIQSASAAYEALRAGAHAQDVAPIVEGCAARADSRLTAAWASHTQALVADDGEALLAASEEFQAIGALRFSAEAAAHAASALARAGLQDSARRAAARCRTLIPNGQGGVPPPIPELEGRAIALTRRERQIAELAARGFSNAEIAERLVLSVRTVESHLFRAMQKLGVSDRKDISNLIDTS
jgi:ATP/maltotriose-dependent transcriptional regulator MalT